MNVDKKKIPNWFYNGKEIIQLTDDAPDLHPQIDGNKIVWQRSEVSETGKAEGSVLLATFDEAESISTQPSDRNYQIIASSTIIILGLIAVCFWKKLFLK